MGRVIEMTMLAGANKRRLDLIAKEIHGGGLSKREKRELTTLQDEFLADLDEKFPLPTQTLDELEALARTLEEGD